MLSCSISTVIVLSNRCITYMYNEFKLFKITSGNLTMFFQMFRQKSVRDFLREMS